MKKGTRCVRRLALLMALLMLLPVNVTVFAEGVTPRASDYLDNYYCYLYSAGGGRMDIYFDVTGTDYLDEIGVLSIVVYESVNNSYWYAVKRYDSSAYSNMMGSGKITHYSSLSYYGIAGRYYKAYVCVWGGMDGTGDTRYFWTGVKKA